MKLQVYTVLDKAVGAYLQPFYARHANEAIRSFTDACQTKDHNFNKYSTDYVLMHLGEFDDGSGLFTCGEPYRIISASECIMADQVIDPQARMNMSLDDMKSIVGRQGNGAA